MGCHTWFYRPVTDEEFEKAKAYAPTQIEDLCGKESGMYDKVLYDALMKSWKENIPCVYKKYWYEWGYGFDKKAGIPYNGIKIVNDKLYGEVEGYWDVFRVYNYPRKVIHNRRELRKFMKKKYFELEQYQLDTVSKFFRENNGGIIMFG